MKDLGVYGWDNIKMAVTGCVYWNLDVRGFLHHSTVHTEKSNKMQQCIKIYYSIFI